LIKHPYLDINVLKATGAQPAWFGLGFVQLKLTPYERVHFWHPELKPDVAEEEIHDHRYLFKSFILAGELSHQVFRFEDAYDGNWEKVQVSCDPNNPAPPMPAVYGNVVSMGVNQMKAGSSYLFPAGEFHRTRAEKAVTLLERASTVAKFARVIRPIGSQPVCPFSNPKPVDELWEIIADCIGPTPRKAGYHLREIEKGELGEASKIREETEEFMDAMAQNSSVMGLVELSDLVGAVEAFLKKHHPSVSLDDLKIMSDITKRAFENGRRN